VQFDAKPHRPGPGRMGRFRWAPASPALVRCGCRRSCRSLLPAAFRGLRRTSQSGELYFPTVRCRPRAAHASATCGTARRHCMFPCAWMRTGAFARYTPRKNARPAKPACTL